MGLISGGSGSGALTSATKTLTNAQVKALPTTAVQVVAAPGASAILVPVHATLRMTWVADYTGIDAGAQLFLENGTQISSSRLIQSVGSAVSGLLAGGGADGTVAFLPASATVPASAGAIDLSGYSGFYDGDVANKAISLTATNAADFTGGNVGNSLKVTLLYYVVTF